MEPRNSDANLIFRVQTRLCALPLGDVVEILRPLPVEPLAGAPAFVEGLCLIRGEPLPVVDTARLLGLDAHRSETAAGRFITVRTGPRRVALAVDAVLGVRRLPAGLQHALPPLLQDAAGEAIATLALLDAELLLVLRSSSSWPQHEAAA